MNLSFTAAAERALAEASAWNSRDDSDDLHAPELLLGLLAEAECRAAEMLLARGVDAERVRTQWPSLQPRSNSAAREFSPALLAAFHAAFDRLWEYPRPLSLATEHLLLGLTAAPGEMADWLASQGFDPQQLEVQIHRLYGHAPGPLSVDPTAAEADADVGCAVHTGTIGTARTETAPPPLASPTDLASLGRVLDAAANRAREGLRVVEDYVRMALDDRHLTRELKHLRHDLQAALATFPADEWLACRDTPGDVGTEITTPAEFARPDIASVAAANWHRLEEALRSLEEFAKVTQPAAAAAVERLRYRAYTLHLAAETTRTSGDRLPTTKLCVLIDGRASEAEFLVLIESLIAAGVPMIQLRDKKLTDCELLGRARLLCARTTAAGIVSIINDRPDIAAAAHADGVHVGQDDLPPSAARTVAGPRALIGVSTHSIEQARRAVLDGANYIGVGPTFLSGTKTFAAFTGVELLQAVATEIRLPAFAIGGITFDNLDAALATGISRIAVSGAIAGAADPKAAASEFLRRLGIAR